MSVITVGEHRDRGVRVPQQRKLIEVWLPLEEVNSESAQSKIIGHGHPPASHLFWVRRPLAIAQRRRELDPNPSIEQKPQGSSPSRRLITDAPPIHGAKTNVARRADYTGRYEVGSSQPVAMTGKAGSAVEEVIHHIVAADGAKSVEIVHRVRAEDPIGFSESVATTIKENSRVIGFDVRDSEDVAW